MFRASSIANTVIILFPILLVVPLTIAMSLQCSQPMEIVIFYAVTGVISIALMLYAKYPNIVKGEYAKFGLSFISKERRWAYISAYVVMVFLTFVTVLTIGLSK